MAARIITNTDKAKGNCKPTEPTMEDSSKILECLTVSNYNSYLPHLLKNLNERKEHFQAGYISDASLLWRKSTSDQEILDIVHGMHIEFNQLPVQFVPCSNTQTVKPRKQEHTFLKNRLARFL